MTKFSSLSLKGWRQFDNIELDIHPTLTVLTGANGAGKSTLLNIFSRHFGYMRPYLATPDRNAAGVVTYVKGVFNLLWDKIGPTPPGDAHRIGFISYGSHRSPLYIPAGGNSISYDIKVESQQNVVGVHFSSHRSLPNYQQLVQLPAAAFNARSAFAQYDGQVRNEYQQGRWDTQPTQFMKQTLIAMAVFGEGNRHVRRDPIAQRAYEGFVAKLAELLPKEIGFKGLEIQLPDVILRTSSGNFLLDASSGGLMVLFDIAWRIYLFSLEQPEFVVTMDEPENHLHPSMQRSLLPSLVRAFPNVQFIVATHSPFVVSSVRESNVYALRHENRDGAVDVHSGARLPTERGVVSTKLDVANKAGNANAILRDVLGLPTTIPDWVREDLQRLTVQYRERTFTKETLQELRGELKRIGMDEFYPDVVAQLAGAHD